MRGLRRHPFVATKWPDVQVFNSLNTVIQPIFPRKRQILRRTNLRGQGEDTINTKIGTGWDYLVRGPCFNQRTTAAPALFMYYSIHEKKHTRVLPAPFRHIDYVKQFIS